MNLKKRYVVFIVLLIAVLIVVIYASFLGSNYHDYPDNYVIRIIDGDTFELADGNIVRLICIDAPEKGEIGSEESTNFLSQLILYEQVRLEKDVSETDDYGRLLRYAYVNISESEVFVNKELVLGGYASVWEYGNDTAKCGEIRDY